MVSPRILFVDDNEDTCELVSFMLKQAEKGYSVTTATTAPKAENFINTEKFDLYILDYRLPEISGVELCRQIRKCDSNTPILFFSAAASYLDSEEAYKAGATDYLVKPDDLFRLPEAVSEHLNRNAV